MLIESNKLLIPKMLLLDAECFVYRKIHSKKQEVKIHGSLDITFAECKSNSVAIPVYRKMDKHEQLTSDDRYQEALLVFFHHCTTYRTDRPTQLKNHNFDQDNQLILFTFSSGF